MPSISVAICTHNSSATIAAACRSVEWSNDVVVVDSGSTDATSEIVARYRARWVREPWRGYTEQKRLAVSLCRNDWVLILDSDEECSPALAYELQRLTEEELQHVDVLHVPRRNYVWGRHVRCWDPDLQSRVIHRRRCRWRLERLHDGRDPTHPTRQRNLSGWLDHRRTRPVEFAAYFDGHLADERIALVAGELQARGKRCRWYDLVLRPTCAFVKFYVWKQGFREGMLGLLLAQQAAFSVRMKYAALWALEHKVSLSRGAAQQEVIGSKFIDPHSRAGFSSANAKR